MTIATFERHIKEFIDALPKGKIIVGLSGGADSVALITALTAVKAQCIAAHCNFGLRGAESDRDEAHSKNIAQLLNTPFISIHFDTRTYMAQNKCSIETACRELRYLWFENIRREHGAKWIAVAHHRDDNNETLLLNLFRGTGLTGLKAMRQVNSHIIRPLLEFSRADTECYLRLKGISFVNDSTNQQNDATRNKIRNIILPCIRQSFPSVDKSISLTASNLSETDKFITEMLEQEKKLWIDNVGTINIRQLTANRATAKFILYSIIKDEGFNITHVCDIIAADKVAASGKYFLSPTGETRLLDRGSLIKININTKLPKLTIETVNANEFSTAKPRNVEFFSSDILKGNLPHLRYWRHGDKIQPFGMNGSKLVSDILSNAKVPLSQKSTIPIVVKDDTIIWVVGLRRSNHFTVKASSEHIVKITITSD